MSAEEQARLRTLVDTYFDFVWRSLRGLGVPSSNADDAAQEVFWIAARKLGVIAPGSERSFLFATARGIAANARRASTRSRTQLDDDDFIARQVDSAPNPEEVATNRQARAVLERVLEEIPEDFRTAFVLFELEAMSIAEIAEVLSIPPGTVASRLRRARELFSVEAARFRTRMERKA